MKGLRLFFLSVYLSIIFADPLSDDYIHSINNQNLTWEAKRYFPKETTISQIRRAHLGSIPGKTRSILEVITYKIVGEIPETFDARDKWINCSSLGDIRDQANCGSCWAFAASEAMTDRICIHSNGTKKISVSAQDLLSCCKTCGEGCDGGEPADAWEYWYLAGIVSGGTYDSGVGCRSYSLAPCDHHISGTLANCSAIPTSSTPECVKKCDAGTNLTYSSELTYGKEPYRIANNVTSIQWEILTNGPVEAEFDVYDDFLVYHKGIYRKSNNATKVGAHDVKIIGWGVENETPYWLIANSWNAEWGEKGFFRIVRGTDHCGIESYIVAGLPDLSNSSNVVTVARITTLWCLIFIIMYFLVLN